MVNARADVQEALLQSWLSTALCARGVSAQDAGLSLGVGYSSPPVSSDF